MPLHTDCRPNSFEDFFGNRQVIDSLSAIIKRPVEKRPHSYLFTGPPGCGKTTLARIMAYELGCQDRDLVERNTADDRSIAGVRNILRKMRLKSFSKGNRGWILDECHMLGVGGGSEKNEAQNAILKALEEPPEHVYFFLCTTDPQRLLKAIRSRCTEFEVGTLTQKQMQQLLIKSAGTVGKEIPTEVLEQIARDSQGHPRDALTILDKIIDLPEKQMLRAAKQSGQIETQAFDLCKALIGRKSWKVISGILNGLEKEEPEGVRRLVIDYASKVLLSGNEQAFLVLDSFREPFYNTGRAGLILACYESVMEG